MEQPEAHSEPVSLSFVVSESYHGVRLDHALVSVAPDVSRSQIGTLIKSGAITVNDQTVKAGYRLKTGDMVEGVYHDVSTGDCPEPQPIHFDLLYEDSHLLVIDKPAGLVVHPGSGNRDETLINGLLFRYRELAEVGDSERPGIVHRLDKETSGLMVVARTRQSHRRLVDAFKNRLVTKKYLTLVHGLVETSGRIVAPIGRHPVKRQKMAVRERDGRYAASSWSVRQTFGSFSLLEVAIETGRTHQIRVHMAHIGHPVAGDTVYGPNRANGGFPRTMLHAWQLRLNHPVTGEDMEFEAEVPPDFQEMLKMLGNDPC